MHVHVRETRYTVHAVDNFIFMVKKHIQGDLLQLFKISTFLFSL